MPWHAIQTSTGNTRLVIAKGQAVTGDHLACLFRDTGCRLAHLFAFRLSAQADCKMTASLDKALELVDVIVASLDAGDHSERKASAAVQEDQAAGADPTAGTTKKKGKPKDDKKKAKKESDVKSKAAAAPPVEPVQQADLRVRTPAPSAAGVLRARQLAPPVSLGCQRSHTVVSTESCNSPLRCTCSAVQVAKIIAVEAVDGSDKLWKCQVDVGDPQPRQIVAGLQQHISKDTMLGMAAVAICNLKAAKLAGQVSEGMLLAASDAEKTLVRTLCPPVASVPGDPVRTESSC